MQDNCFSLRQAWARRAWAVPLFCAILLGAQTVLAQVPSKRFRRLAPGVETTIPVNLPVEETFSTHDIVELRAMVNLDWTPNTSAQTRTLFNQAKAVVFRQPITALQYTFKPLRMIPVDIPQPSGKLQRKLIWYMVYRVKNVGGHLTPERNPDGTYGTKKADDLEVFFNPLFVLESHEFKKAYLDRVIPVALGPIQQREDPNRHLLNSVQMAKAPIPLSDERVDRSVWGVVTWLDVDPRIDFFSVFIQGLSSSYRWMDQEGVYNAGDPPGRGRRFVRKTLQLNFWRPGDEFLETEEEIKFGTPPEKSALYGVKEGVDYAWIYR